MRLNTFKNTQSVSKQKGFTLIELVVVIVILGILAVTAAPKFIDLTSDARGSVVQGVKGAINSAADLAHARALVDGATGAEADGDTITVGTDTIDVNFGWPTATDIQLLLDVEEVTAVVSGTDDSIVTYTHDGATTPATCVVTYTNAVTDTETRPTIESVITGC